MNMSQILLYKCILNLLVIQRIQSICELVLDIEEGRRTILWCTAVFLVSWFLGTC